MTDTATETPTPTRRRPAAVLWDMDGTIVDTEEVWIEAAEDIVRELAPGASLRPLQRLVGMSLPDGAEVIRGLGVPLHLEEIVRRQVALVLDKTRGRALDWRPGAVELIAALAAERIPLALVTMSYRVFAEEVLAGLPGEPFAVVVAGDEVEVGKPHPEAYLRAARLLGVAPADCVAIEDSPVGLRAARDAGIAVIGVPRHVELGEDEADALWPTLVGRGPEDLRLPLRG